MDSKRLALNPHAAADALDREVDEPLWSPAQVTAAANDFVANKPTGAALESTLEQLAEAGVGAAQPPPRPTTSLGEKLFDAGVIRAWQRPHADPAAVGREVADLEMARLAQVGGIERQRAPSEPAVDKRSLASWFKAEAWNVTSRGLQGYGSGPLDPELVQKNYPPDLREIYERLGGAAAKVTRLQLDQAFERFFKRVLRALPEDFGLAHLPPSLKPVLERVQRQLIYSDRADRARDGDPFPDGVVDKDFVFRNYFEGAARRQVSRLVAQYPVFEQLKRLEAELRNGCEVIVGEGTSVSLKPEAEVDGKKLTLFRAEPPFLCFQTGNEVLLVSAELSDFWTRISLNAFRDISKNDARDREMNLAWLFVGVEPRGDAERQAYIAKEKRRGVRLEGDPDVESFAKLVAHLDRLYAGGAHQADILDASAAIERDKTAVTAELLRRMAGGLGAVGILRQVAEWVPQLPPLALGDADLYIKLEDQLKDTTSDDDDNEIERTLVEGQGPLLTFKNVASGASFAVLLEPLAEGRLEVERFYDAAPVNRISLDAEGKAQAPIREDGIASFVFELEWAFEELRQMIAEKRAAGR